MHLWLCFDYESVTEPERLLAYEALLDKGEQERLERFTNSEARHRYLVTRVMVRTVLSRYAALEPVAWQFTRTPAGRPFVSGPPDAPRLPFSVTNTGGLIACLISGGSAEIGVDAENCRRKVDYRGIAARFFSAVEAAKLGVLANRERAFAFYASWTLREAYLKARGIGLAAPLAQIVFDLRAPIRARFGPDVGDVPERWMFELVPAGDRHVLAVAVARETENATLKVHSLQVA